METIGKITKNGFVEKERTSQGRVYKDLRAFYPGGGVCYVSEYGGDFLESYPTPPGYIREDFGIVRKEDDMFFEFANAYYYGDLLKLADGHVDLAYNYLCNLGWESPETYAAEVEHCR